MPTTIETLQQVSIRLKDSDHDIVFANLALEERMLSTGHFSFVWKNEFNDEYSNDQEQFIQEYIGKDITISFEDNHTFNGIILEIHFYRNDGLTQEFNISGQGAAVKLQDQAQSASYYKKDLKHIVEAALTGVPANALSVDAQPKNTSEQFYIVQYNETDFAFLSHLAIRFGEWFYFDGEALKFGAINEDALSLNADSDVYSASMSSQLSPLQINTSSYNSFEGENINYQSSAPNASGLLSTLTEASGNAYDRTPEKFLHVNQSPTADVLQTNVDLEVKARTARMILYTAKSRNSAIQLGRVIKIVSGNKSSEYIVISLKHSSNANQSYQNEFVAIPKSVEVPHYTDSHWFPKCETHSAKVVENVDADGHDRLKVHFPWQQGNENTPWIRMQNPYAGKDKGFRFNPEVGEEVIVGFENSNAEKPYVIGTMYHGAAMSGHNSDGNNVKVFRSLSGCRMIMNDDDGSIKLVDKAGSYIWLCGDGNVEVVAAKNFKFQAGENGTIETTKNMDVTVGEDLKETIAGKASMEVGSDCEQKVGTNLTIQAGAELSIEAGSNASIKACANMEVEGGANAKFKGIMTEVSGTAQVEVKGATATLSGDAMTTVKGAMVMIN
jgi:type VI secretion system secreted protein VgrG